MHLFGFERLRCYGISFLVKGRFLIRRVQSSDRSKVEKNGEGF
jgi:hypothetical protein